MPLAGVVWVLIGAAYAQGRDGVSIRSLADHIQLAPTHVTTEVGRLIRKGLLMKKINPFLRIPVVHNKILADKSIPALTLIEK